MNKVSFTQVIFVVVFVCTGISFGQNESILDLDFLIGKWEAREGNFEKKW